MHFADVIGKAHYNKEAIIVERKGKPFAVVVSPEHFEKIREQEEQAWRVIEQLQERNTDKDPDEVLRDVTETVEQVRQEMYEQGKSRKAAKRSS